MAERFARLKAAGLCVQCGHAPAISGQAKCETCAAAARERARNRMRRLRPAWRALGICQLCGCREAITGQSWCGVCAEQQLEHKKGKAA